MGHRNNGAENSGASSLRSKFHIPSHIPSSTFSVPSSALRRGQLAVEVLFFATLAVIMISGFIFLAASFVKLSVRDFNREQAFEIAESGIEYYRWHLAHNPNDFWDGQGATSTPPYVHTYYDKDGNPLGTFSLTITPFPHTTIIKIRSTGTVAADTSIAKIIEAKMGIPSWSQYSAAANSFIAFGSTEQVYGIVHSNAGVRVDGIAYNNISSALATTTDPDYGTVVWGVHTNKAPADFMPPTPYASHADVFRGGRTLSVPALDFNGLTATLASLKTTASSSGSYYASSSAQGYHIILKSNGTYDLYKVTSLISAPGGCSNTKNETRWGTWSINNQTFIKNTAYPSSTGVIFLEDNVWVDGTLNAPLTIASGRFPELSATNSDIIINGNLTYSVNDGSVALGLIGQGNVRLGLKSLDTEEIDAAMIAKNGGTIRNYYSSSCGNGYLRAALISRGMQATNTRGYFAWGNISSGYQTQQTIYDTNLLYGPPPSFPLTTDQYSQLSWQEIQ
jgi:hypothetical protein